MTSLKQLNPLERIIFLKKFTEELLRNSIEEEETIKRIKVEKLKNKFFQPYLTPEQAFRKIIKTPTKEKIIPIRRSLGAPRLPLKIPERILGMTQRVEGSLSTRLRKSPPKRLQPRRPQKPKGSLSKGMQKSMQIPTQSQAQTQTPTRTEIVKTIQPVAQPKPEGFNLGNLEAFLKDPSIQSIECSGPGKNILIKKRNRMNGTKVSLGENEITALINNFSKESRIPVLGGILKAAVGDLVISAIISEFVGSRFIINRIVSYSRAPR